MTHSHRLALTDYFPRLGAAPRLLDPTGLDLPDPVGQDAAVYEECARQIWKHLQPLAAEIVPGTRNGPGEERNES